MYKCELCRELSGDSQFAGEFERVIFHSKRFIILPSLGPLHPQHVLLCSRRHFTGLHEMGQSELDELRIIFRAVERAYYRIHGENFISFENGGDREATPACSVLHYHMHIVPTSRPFATRDTQKSVSCFRSIYDAANAAAILKNYLLVKAPNHSFEISDRDGLPSQYMRQLVARYNRVAEWDWRKSERPKNWIEVRKGLNVIVQFISEELGCHASSGVAA